jgi:hypothetical protein
MLGYTTILRPYGLGNPDRTWVPEIVARLIATLRERDFHFINYPLANAGQLG